MKLATLAPNDLALIKDQTIMPLGQALSNHGIVLDHFSMNDLIARWDELKPIISKEAANQASRPLDVKALRPPVPNPSKIWAAASNYERGSSGLDDARGRGRARVVPAEELLERIFLKPPSAIIGPGENIIIPRDAETIFPELELCVVIGKKARHVPKEKAIDFVFGYTIILDVTARGYGSGTGLAGTRCVRKGFETFAPIGPWITTKEEIENPHDLEMKLWVNGELRQSAKTDSMINDVSGLLSYLSGVTTLYPGDLIATGNPDSPEFQQKLQSGDMVKSEIEGIGAMTQGVAKER